MLSFLGWHFSHKLFNPVAFSLKACVHVSDDTLMCCLPDHKEFRTDSRTLLHCAAVIAT